MAVSLILKNSSVEDRHPTANQLTNGEISLNYNEAGAFLSCRDTNGDIQHIGGVKIDDATPGSPSKQALWFQPSTSKLFIYDGTGWLVVASGGGSGPGSDTVDQILSGNGINSDPSTGLGVITLDADLNFSRGLEFVAGQIAIAIGAGLEFDVNGRLANTAGAIQYRGTLDLTSSDPTPTSPVQGDTWINTADGTSNAVWNPDIPTGTTVGVGDLVIYNGTIWTFLARGLSPAERTDLGLGVVDGVSVEVTSSTGSNVQLPAATGTTAGVLTAADKLIIDEGASTWERNGSTLQPVNDTYDVKIGGTLPKAPNITLNGTDGSAAFAGQVNGLKFSGGALELPNTSFLTRINAYGINDEKVFSVDRNGTVNIGGTLPSAPAISLNANGSITAVGSVSIGGTAAANTIDEYEEGNFLPRVKGLSSAGSPTYATRQGWYVKVGNIVHVEINLIWTDLNTSGGSGLMRFDDLPFNFNAAARPVDFSFFTTTIGSLPTDVSHYSIQGSALNEVGINVIKDDGTGFALNCIDNWNIRISGSYIIW